MLNRRGMFDSEVGAGAPTPGGLQVSFNYALRVWWAYYWPTSLVSFVAVAVIAFWLRAFAGLAFPARYLPLAIRVLPYVVTYAVAILVIRYLLGKRFRHFQVSLLQTGTAPSGEPLPRTFRRTVRVWWAFSWRALLYSLIVTVAATIPLGFLLGALALLGGFAATAARVLTGTVIGGAVGMYIFYSNILGEEFGDFRVCLVPLEVPGRELGVNRPDDPTGSAGDGQA